MSTHPSDVEEYVIKQHLATSEYVVMHRGKHVAIVLDRVEAEQLVRRANWHLSQVRTYAALLDEQGVTF